ncbi:MAG: hypothetical protein NTZ54_08185, partial [Alphaproteobacteria bacterium]|nr:hypothetical protein [Alphaproteobacteria bacterium]
MMLAVFFVRVNIFIWLAPLMVLAAIYEPRGRLSYYLGVPQGRLLMTASGSLILLLSVLSWRNIISDPHGFLLGFIDNNSEGLLMQIQSEPLKNSLLALLVLPILVSMAGLWLPLMICLRIRVRHLKALEPWDRIPFLLFLVAAVFAFLGPLPPNGDISEFRHRGGPLLMIVTMVWSVHYLVIVLTPILQGMTDVPRRTILITCAFLPFLSLPLSISTARSPRMLWGQELFGRTFAPDLIAVAKDLYREADRQTRFVVAGASPDSRLYDDAVVIV